MNLPCGFADKMQSLLKDEYEDYLACFKEPRYYGLRVNTGKISVEEFKRLCPFEITPVPWISNGFYYNGEKVTPSKHPYYFAGLYYLQEPSAMTPADRLPVEPGDKVLDLCAAPGGKATELGAKLGGSGVLAANDISNSRAKGLLKNIEVFGIGNVLVLSEEPGKLVDYFAGYFDKILIDAPCSGEGMFRKDKKMVKAWEEHGPEYFKNIQKSIILQAAQMLRPGGQMLYSTCTFDPGENEQVIGHLLENCPEFEIEEIEQYEGFAEGMPNRLCGICEERKEELRKTVRIFPHRMKGEGHYLALLRKGNGTDAKDVFSEVVHRNQHKTEKIKVSGKESSFRTRTEKLPEEFLSFLQDTEKEFDLGRMKVYGERIYYMPEGLPDLKGIRFLRTGLLMGELKKNRFEPSQAFAMSLKKEEYRKVIDLRAQDERVMRYLKGETLDVSELVNAKAKGWHLVCVDGFPLGWGKLAGGTLKNKYLAGWRLV